MQVVFRDSFSKDMDKLKNKVLKGKILEAIAEIDGADSLKDIKGIKKLQGYIRHFRIRVGDYRLGIYQQGNTIELVRFLHRKDIYKYFP